MVGSGFGNIFKIPELKKRLLFTAALLAVYRIGVHVPTPGIDGAALKSFFDAIICIRARDHAIY
jgi:preprotein translocase subunit SecY